MFCCKDYYQKGNVCVGKFLSLFITTCWGSMNMKCLSNALLGMKDMLLRMNKEHILEFQRLPFQQIEKSYKYTVHML